MASCSTIGAVLLGVTCAPTFDGPGTERDFLKARYACIKEATIVSKSYGHVGKSGGFLEGASAPSCGVIWSCLSLKGYNMVEDGKFIIPEGQGVSCLP